MFEVAEGYEEMMGRWSRQLAPLFLEFVGVQDGEKVLDVGCGTGSLAATLARVSCASKIIGIDPSSGLLEYARAHVKEPHVTFDLGDAQSLPYEDKSFDRTMALLVVNFIPDASTAAKEMRRVTKSGGIVATTMWAGGRANELNHCLWNAAVAIDPTVTPPSARRGSYGSAEALSALLTGAGLTHIEVTELTMPCEYSSFNELWRRFLTGEGPGGAYVLGLKDDHREALRQRLRHDVLHGDADGPFSLQAKAWAVKGKVP
jgi:SAM-dependent methyltransferase